MSISSDVCLLGLLSKNKTSFQPIYRFEIFNKVAELPIQWEVLMQNASSFLQQPYLQALENAQPKDYQFYYLLIYEEAELIGFALAHSFLFRGIENVKIDTENTPFRQNIQRALLRWLNFNFLVLGNATLTGEYGFHFKSKIPSDLQLDLLRQAANQLNRQLDQKTDILVIKDLQEDKREAGKTLFQKRFHEMHIQPNMVMDLLDSWTNFGDYLGALRSKYRVRVRRAFKKLGNIKTRWLKEKDLEVHQKQMYELYQQVADNAEMNVQEFPPHYFLSLKQQLQSDFQVLGYFLEDKLVGFSTAIHDHSHLEAHFLGFDMRINQQHQLYLNMLFDLIRYAVDNKVENIAFSRSAIEIKSSIGAVPQDLYSYVKHCNPLINSLLPFFLKFLGGEQEWVWRAPFK
ncbi:MAG: GNAT family N-acetyltransferase [Bacteroidota bacterium]